jgi:hypothetical protein
VLKITGILQAIATKLGKNIRLFYKLIFRNDELPQADRGGGFTISYQISILVAVPAAVIDVFCTALCPPC